MFRIVVVAALIVVAMGGIKDGRALKETGILSSCKAVATPLGYSGYWEACRPGKLEGRPNLARMSCVSQGFAQQVEYWSCPSPIRTGQTG